MDRLRLVLNIIKTAKHKEIYIKKDGASIAVRDSAPKTSRYMLIMQRILFITFPFLFPPSFIFFLDISQLDRSNSIILLLFGVSYAFLILLIWLLLTALLLPKDHKKLLA